MNISIFSIFIQYIYIPYDCLKRMTGWQPARVLYFGDHPYADLADLSMYHGWRTCAIIEELEEEIDKANHPDMKLKVNWSNELQKLLNTYQDCSDDPDCRVLLNEWKDELEQLRQVFIFFLTFLTDNIINGTMS